MHEARNRELAYQYRNGTLRQINAARRELILHNQYLAERLAKQNPSKYISYEIRVADGIIGLIKAIEEYDIKDEQPFHEFAKPFIQREIRTVIYRAGRQGKLKVAKYYDIDSLTYRSTPKNDNDKVVYKLLEVLTNKQRKIIEDKFLKNLSNAELANDLNVCKKTIENVVGRSLSKMRNKMQSIS